MEEVVQFFFFGNFECKKGTQKERMRWFLWLRSCRVPFQKSGFVPHFQEHVPPMQFSASLSLSLWLSLKTTCCYKNSVKSRHICLLTCLVKQNQFWLNRCWCEFMLTTLFCTRSFLVSKHMSWASRQFQIRILLKQCF